MSRGVNKVILIGHVGADPESRVIPSGATVANFRLATTESWKDKQSGDKQERTEWHNCVVWGRLAEIVSEYCTKGKLVYCEGRLQTRKWQDKQGNDRYTTEIVVQELQMLGGGSREGGQPARAEREENLPYQGAQPTTRDDFDDDIPFSWAAVVPLLGLLMGAAHGAQALF